MNMRNKDLPATMLAFELNNNTETFIARQLVNSESEKEGFKSRYNGKLIKIKSLDIIGNSSNGKTGHKRHRYLTGTIMFMIVLAIIPVAIYEFSRSWIRYCINKLKDHSTDSYSAPGFSEIS